MRVLLHRSQPRYWHLLVVALTVAGVIGLATCGIGKIASAHYFEECEGMELSEGQLSWIIHLFGADTATALHIISHESSCDTDTSGMSYGGLFQFTRGTADSVGKRLGWSEGWDRTDPYLNIYAGWWLSTYEGWHHWRVCSSWKPYTIKVGPDKGKVLYSTNQVDC